MTQSTLSPVVGLDLQRAFPMLRLLNPKQYTREVLVSLAIGLVASYTAVVLGLIPLWAATALVLLLLLPAGVLKWRDDRRRYGVTAMILSILVMSQGLHTVEHLVQWVQYHVLYFTMRLSNGLLSPANAEWVHFVWNWSVLIAVILLLGGGMRNVWIWLLLAVAGFHAIEHSYTFIRWQLVISDLRGMGLMKITAQGLPGIIGRDGWLARSEWTRGTFLCSMPGLTTAVRLDVHFWWNVLVIALLVIAGHFYLRAPQQRASFDKLWPH